MKIKYLFTGLLATILIISGCKDPDSLVMTDSENITGLTVKGRLFSDEKTEYNGVIDKTTGDITIQVPYYISDTEAIQGDLTQMKIRAIAPVGAYFEPNLSGIHNLVEGFKTILVNMDGTKESYTIKAIYVKSALASINKVELTDYSRAIIRIVEPENKEGKGKIIVYKTSSAIDLALKSAAIKVSPWATIQTSAMDPITGLINLSDLPEITIISQNGIEKTTYETSLVLPELLPKGVGYIATLFGFQTYTDDAHGFEAGANRTMAIVGDYLIISNSSDYTKMIVMDRYNGKILDVKVNTQGIDEGRSIHAITSDDAGHLVAMAYTSTKDIDATSPNVRAWVWAKGIENAPKSIVYANINGSTFANAPVGINGFTKLDLGRTISVKGDLTSGDAIIATAAMAVPRPVFLMFKDGVMQSKAYVEWGGGQIVSMWKATKIKPLTNTLPLGYIWSTANFRQGINYTPVGTGSRAIEFSLPTSHWWKGSATYDKNVRGIDYINFNGTCLLGIQNGLSNNGAWYHRLYVSNISDTPDNSTMAGGFIFDSREGNASGTSGIPGTGFSVTGMTSSSSFVSGKQVLGTNEDETGDVVFGRSADGNAVQVYMLTADQGLLAYEITRFKL